MDLTELERLAKAATPGPWCEWAAQGMEGGRREIRGEQRDEYVCSSANDNAAYIAALSPERILAMIEVCREAENLRRRFEIGLAGYPETRAYDWARSRLDSL